MAFARIRTMALTSALALGLGVGGARPAEAAFTFTFAQQGADVVGTGSGSINTAALSIVSAFGGNQGFVIPNQGWISFAGDGALWGGMSGPANFGPGGGGFQPTFTGAEFWLRGSARQIGLPYNYVSGTVFSNSVLYTNRTIAQLGMTPGTYVWTWGSGETADSFTVQVGAPAIAAVPEPLSAGLLAVGLVGLAAARRARRRDTAAPA